MKEPVFRIRFRQNRLESWRVSKPLSYENAVSKELALLKQGYKTSVFFIGYGKKA